MNLEFGEIHREFNPTHLGHQMCVEVAPRLACGLGAAGHRHRLEETKSLEAAIVGEQKFSAPDRPVVAPAEAVKHDAERRGSVERNAVFDEARRDMGVMVLGLDQRQRLRSRPRPGEFGRQIFRMPIGDESARGVTEKLGVKRQVLPVVVEGFDVLQIALMLGQDGLAVLDETEGRLELPSKREKFGRRLEPRRQRDGRRREAARAPQQPDSARHLAGDGVVDAIGDLPVMHERISRDVAKPRRRRAVVDDLRLLGEIAARHHHGALDARQHHEMQRRRRQHEAEGRKTGGDLVRQFLGLVGLKQHDRRLGAGERRSSAGPTVQ